MSPVVTLAASTTASPGASASGQSLLPETTDLFTAAHIALILVLAVLVIAGLIYGTRLRARRREAQVELTEHNDALRDEGVDEAPAADRRAPDEPTPPVAAPAQAPADSDAANGPVTQLKGLGPRVAERLAEQGITTVGQLAALTDDEAQALDSRLGPFAGRMGRDRWQEQARFLAAGDKAGFEAVFGRL